MPEVLRHYEQIIQGALRRAAELETPVPVVDQDRMEANIARLQSYLDELPCYGIPERETETLIERTDSQWGTVIGA